MVSDKSRTLSTRGCFSLDLIFSLLTFSFGIFFTFLFYLIFLIYYKNTKTSSSKDKKIKILSHLYLISSLTLSLSLTPKQSKPLFFFLSLGFVRLSRLIYTDAVANQISELSFISSPSNALSNGVVSVQSR